MTRYTVRRLPSPPHPAGWWGAYAPGADVPACTGTQGNVLTWIRAQGSTAFLDHADPVPPVPGDAAAAALADAPVGSCDRCGALAYVELSGPAGAVLTVCAHHYAEHAPRLTLSRFLVTRDARHLLTERA